MAIPSSIRLHVSGERACFSRPELKVERVSYDLITPSAARGILEAVLWKPQMRWTVTRIDVLEPIRRESVRRNEVSDKAAPPGSGGPVPRLFVEDKRQQRASLILRDVAYVIHARIELTAKAGPDDPLTKYIEMFQRRARQGQCFHQPYLGCREFAADFRLIEDDEPDPAPHPISQKLGYMLHDIVFRDGIAVPRFFEAELRNGILDVPPPDSPEVRA